MARAEITTGKVPNHTIQGKAQGRTCWNCRWLSAPAVVEFGGGQREARVICDRGLWPRGSVLEKWLSQNPARFRERAEQCANFEDSSNSQPSTVLTQTLDTGEGEKHLTRQD